ncbi:MAG: hypothetical protein ACI4W6_08140 [Acutalibacteraceae bacterium]
MKKNILSEKAQSFILLCYEVFSVLQKEIETISQQKNIGESFSKTVRLLNNAQIRLCEKIPDYTVYVPILKLSKSNTSLLIERNKQLNRCKEDLSRIQNSDAAKKLYEKRNKQIEKTLFSKAENAPQCKNVELLYISAMLLLCKATVSAAKNTYRFETCEALDKIIIKTISDEQEKIRKLDYLFHCITGR